MNSKILISLLLILFSFKIGFTEPIIYQEQIDSLKNEINNTEIANSTKAKLLSRLANIYSKQENFSEAKRNNFKALEIFQSLNDYRNSCKVLLDLAMNYDKSNQFDQAIDYSYKALDVLELIQPDLTKKEFDFRKGMIFMNMGIIYGQIGNEIESLKLLTQAEKLLSKAEPFYIAICSENLGNVYSQLGKYDEGLSYFKIALEFYLDNNVEPVLISNTLNNIGGIYRVKKQYDMALREYDKALSYIGKEDIYISEKSGILNSIADVYIDKQNLDSALFYLNKSMKLSGGEEGQRFLKDNYESRVRLYSKQNKYKEAFENLQMLKNIEDSLYEPVLLEKIANIKSEYDFKVEQKDNILKIQLLERDKQLNQYRTYTLIGVIILILFIVFLLYNRQKQISRLKSIDLRHTKLEKKQLADKLKFKNNQLTNYAIYIVKKNEFLDTIKSEIDDLREEGDTKLNSLSKIVNQHISESQDRKDFEIRVKNENQDFYYKLNSKYPDLSEKNKNLCSLLLLELSSKEIASFMNISVESVEKSRYRLRKRLEIPREINISTFLNNL